MRLRRQEDFDLEERQLIGDQLAYYRARASEYDEWFLRQGCYDRGPEHREKWSQEIAKVEANLLPLVQGKDILELAAGTGLWTKRLVDAGARRILAIDGSPETLAINRTRTNAAAVEYQVADIFSWNPSQTFDLVFFSFWLSHVPVMHFEAFWDLVRRALRRRGKVLFIDSLLEQSSTATDHLPLNRSGVASRRLNDGREFQIVKIFYSPDDLQMRLTELGWTGFVRRSGQFFLFGSMERSCAD
jgi:SAM-dependent methyltransferase